jgi:hypothetical protein
MERQRLLIIWILATNLIIVPALSAQATSTPTWASSPAILATNVASSGLDSSTKIFGFHTNPAGGVFVVSNQCGNWWKTNGDSFTIAGGGTSWDGSPAAAYADTSNIVFWVCAHRAFGGSMYCQRAKLGSQSCAFAPTYDPVDSFATPVGTTTFGAWSDPVLVRFQTIYGQWIVDIFARGQNNQIWGAHRFDTDTNWSGWSQLPAIAGGFDSSPGVTTFAADGRLIICARQASDSHFVCANQVWGMGGSLSWSSWSEVPGYPQVGSKPALARSDSSIYLFGVVLNWPQTELVSYLPTSGGLWSTNSQVGSGSGFLYSPAAFATAGGSTVLTVAEGGDSTYYWDTGSSSGWNNGWTQIQVSN